MSVPTKLVVLAIVLVFGLALFVLGVDMVASPNVYEWLLPPTLCTLLGQFLMVLAFMATFGIIAYMLGIGREPAQNIPQFTERVPVPPDEAIAQPSRPSPETPRTPVAEPEPRIAPELDQPVADVEECPHLLGLTGGLPERVKIPRGVFTIGRGQDCDLILASQLVSRRHAQLEWTGEHLLIRDLGSSNKTRVNDKDLDREIALQDGDVIQIIDYHLEVELPISQSRTIIMPRPETDSDDDDPKTVHLSTEPPPE